MPAIRPRISSGIDAFHIVWRNMPLMASAPPATTRVRTPTSKPFENPNPATESPQMHAAATMARPWWRTRLVHCDVIEARSAPMGSPA
jgi:hypothetical protein